MSYLERVIYVQELKSIADAAREATGQAKVLTASDVERRK